MINQQSVMLRGDGPALLVSHQQADGAPILYIHGATFPSALSAAYRFEGHSWMDDWNARGYDAWAFDFAGYGGSDRYAEMDADCAGAPVGRATDAAVQIARVVAHIAAVTGHARISLVAHSWGTIPAALFAALNPEAVHKLCLFGPVLHRDGIEGPARNERWRLVTIAQQHARFIADVPPDHPPVLIEPQLHAWGPAYLASDAGSGDHGAVKIPNGPSADVADAWSGRLAYRPEDLRCPTLCVRGEWDSVTSDADAAWLMSKLSHPASRDVKIPKGTHLMHLEFSREALFAEVGRFLSEVSS